LITLRFVSNRRPSGQQKTSVSRLACRTYRTELSVASTSIPNNTDRHFYSLILQHVEPHSSSNEQNPHASTSIRMQEYQNSNMSAEQDTRSSRRLSGQNLEMPPMVKQPSLHPSRTASRNTSRQPTREPSLNPNNQYLQEQAQQEYEEQDDPVTTPQIQ